MEPSKRIAIYYNPAMARYDLGKDHPFKADRFARYMELLRKFGIDKGKGIEFLRSPLATDGDLLLVHTHAYVMEVKGLARRGGTLSLDTPVNPGMLEGAMAVVGAALKGADDLAKGKYDIAMTFGGFHHAGRDNGEGFCLFNDVAIAAKALLERHGMKRVLVIDTDAHQGNGTMDIFYEDPCVLFISIHQDPRTLYPGRGFTHETGRGDGSGFTVNIPMPPYSGDIQWARALREIYLPLCVEFKPDAVIRNGGSDPMKCDTLTNLSLSLEGLEDVGRIVREGADNTCGKLLDLTFSGYGDMVEHGWLALFSGITGIRIDYDLVTQPSRERKAQAAPKGLDEQADAVIRQLKLNLKEHCASFR
ncbi:MAG: hypothetical protein HZB92_01915 [Euryarchaeota archaeon]|nr:hypothetical protein [Euryarchaeota archaeon]